MLTDPFYQLKPAYSDNYTGIVTIDENTGTDAVALLNAIKGTLELAGWTLVDGGRVESTATLEQVTAMMPVAVPPLVAVPPVFYEDACTRLIFPQWVMAHVGGAYYIGYDPYVYFEPPECGDGRVYFPMGATYAESAENLAAKITETTDYLVSYTGERTDPNMPLMAGRLLFKWEAEAPAAYGLDYLDIGMAGGSQFSSKGFWTLQSPVTENGGYLLAKLQLYAISSFGIDENAILGSRTPFITVTGSGGGEYSQAIWPSGGYWMAAGPHQFVIWSDRAGRKGSAMLASMPLMDVNHWEGAEPAVCVGNESYSWFGLTTNFEHLTNNLHWEYSFASSFLSRLRDMGWRTQEASNLWRDPAMMHRGLRGMPLLTIANAPLVQSAYVLISDDPNKQKEDRIAGRMWDMIVSSTTNFLAESGEETSLFDGRTWRKFSMSTASGDVTGSMWVREKN